LEEVSEARRVHRARRLLAHPHTLSPATAQAGMLAPGGVTISITLTDDGRISLSIASAAQVPPSTPIA
jgi:phage tail sheath gpL-like